MRTLRQTLEREGLTADEAAHALGVSKPTIYRWLDVDPYELPGKVTLWCLGLMKVDWPEPFKPSLELSITPETTDAALERRLELANRVLRTAVKALVDVNDLRGMVGREAEKYPFEEEAHGPEKSQGDDWKLRIAENSPELSLTEKMPVVSVEAMNALHPSGEKPKTTSFSAYSLDREIADQLSRRLGMNQSAVIRYALRRLAEQELKE